MQAAIAVATFFDLYAVDRQELLLGGLYIGDWLEVITAAAASGADTFVFRTSGSAGPPRAIKHPSAFLLQEVEYWAHLMAQWKVERVVVPIPVHHAYGAIWGVLLPDRLGIPTLECTPGEILSSVTAGDAVVATPNIWGVLVGGGQRDRGVRLAVSSAGALEKPVRQAIVDGVGPLCEVYGATEIGGVGYRGSGRENYELLPFWRRGEGTSLVRKGPDGLDREFDALDVLQWFGEREFRVHERLDQSVKIGGALVSPAWVENQLRKIGNVVECSVRTQGHAENCVLKAFVVLERDNEEARRELVWSLRDILPGHAVPRYVSFGTALPRNSMGKLVDWSVECPS